MYKLILIFFALCPLTWAQDSSQFSNEVSAIQKKYDTVWNPTKKTTVFTGSSSIRIWHDVQEKFPKHQIVNSGFGGSQASDLLKYSSELILQFKPTKVFIYEGDNDIAAGKNSTEIISDILSIIEKIREQNPAAEVILIAAKPSLARWDLKKKYKQLNRKFKKLSRKDAELHFADVWKPMLNGKKVKQDLFLEDGLHMNAKGYAIWHDVLEDFIEN